MSRHPTTPQRSLPNGNRFPVWLIPLFLFVLSLILRLLLISKGPYHLDCLGLAINAQTTLSTQQLQAQFGPGYPLTVLLGAAFVALTGGNNPVFGVNLMSVIFSALCVPIFYYFLKNISGTTAAFFGTILLILHPIFWSLSVYGNSHTVSAFFMIAAAFFLTRKDLRNGFWIGWICLGLMGAARLQDMILVSPAMIILAGFTDRKKLFRAFWGLVIAFTIAAVFHAPYLIGQQKSSYTNQLSSFAKIGLWENFRGLLSPNLFYSFGVFLISTSALGIVLGIYGTVKTILSNKTLGVFLVAWFIIPLLFYGNLYSTVPRFFMTSLLALCASVGIAMQYLLSTPKWVFRIALSVFFTISIMMPAATNTFPILRFRNQNALYQDWGREISRLTEENAYITSGDDDFLISYYSGRRMFIRPKDFRSLDPRELSAYRTQLSQLLDAGEPVYITSFGLFSYNPNSAFSRMMEKDYELIPVGSGMVEGWHNGELILDILRQTLYRIELKKNHRTS